MAFFRFVFLLLILALPQPVFGQTSAITLEQRYNKIRKALGEYSPGGLKVLDTAYRALQSGNYHLVGIEDLWAIALKEGMNLFDSPRLWSATGPQQTGDMLGQTTVGPWQITLETVRIYVTHHGMQQQLSDSGVIQYVEDRPEPQAMIAADYIEESYRTYGVRTPYALQNYFWLEGFLQKKIGQGPWYASVLAKDPEQMRNTGFYAKQLLLGSRFNPHGLLYWLYITDDTLRIRRTLESWQASENAITMEDLRHCDCEFLHELL